MPRSAVAAGCVDFVLSPEDIAHEIARIAKHPAVARAASGSSTPADGDRTSATTHEDDDTPLPSGGRGTPPTGAERARAEADRGAVERIGATAEDGFKKILLLLRNHSGVDFSLYKSSTIQRRITRRMVLSKHDTLERLRAVPARQHEGARRPLLRRAHQRDEFLPQPGRVRRAPAQGPADAPAAAERRPAPRLGARLLHRPGGVLHRHGVRRSRREGAADAQAPGLRHGSQRRAAGQSPARPLREEPRAGSLAGTAAAVLRRGGGRLSGHQGAARDGRLRPAEPHQPTRPSRASTSSAAATC